MKRIVCFCILFCLVSVCFADTVKFSDIENHWAKDVVEAVARDGAIEGYDDGTFMPDKEVSVAEFLKILVYEQDYKMVVDGNRWPDWYVNTALKYGLISKDDFTDYFAPLKRIDACKIIANYIGLDDVKKSTKSFKDLSNENKDIVLKLVNLGIISGYKDDTFRENDIVTRAQACKIINKAYYERASLIENRSYKPTPLNTNISNALSGDSLNQIRYEIKNNRLYINDTGRFGKFENVTLNQEYIDDKMIIKLINNLVDDNTYTAVMYVPDKYTINSLNVCFGNRQGYINNGSYIFQIRFYENGNYNVAQETDIEDFCDDAYIKIDLFQMWDKLSEFDNDLRASDKNMHKLEKALKSLFGESVSKDLIKYIKEKMILAKSIPNDDSTIKFAEVKKFGKYTFNILCTRDQQLQIYVKRPKK